MGEIFGRRNVLNSFGYVRTKLTLVFTHPSVVKWYLSIGHLSYFSILITSIILSISPSFFSHPISDLGNSGFSSAPFMFDFSCIIGTVSIIPLFIYFHKGFLLHSSNNSRTAHILSYLGLFLGIMGSIGLSLLGIFSLDRGGPDNIYHGMAAGVAFTGFIFSIVLFGICIFLFQTRMHKSFGGFGIIAPLLSLGLWAVFKLPVFEWILFFSILSFIIPINIKVITHEFKDNK